MSQFIQKECLECNKKFDAPKREVKRGTRPIIKHIITFRNEQYISLHLPRSQQASQNASYARAFPVEYHSHQDTQAHAVLAGNS